MTYVSLLYLLVFLPLVFVAYQLTAKAHRWKVLLGASYLFFFSLSYGLIIYLLAATLSTYFTGIWLQGLKSRYAAEIKEILPAEKAAYKKLQVKRQRLVLALGVAINLGMLLFLKYFNFFGANINTLLQAASVQVQIPLLQLALPVGISFYTLQALSYVVDVYQGKLEADKNLGRKALYMAFFPTIMEGPICRYTETAHRLYEGNAIEYKNLTFGSQRILWGLFKKLLIADRLNPFVNNVFTLPEDYTGAYMLLAAIFYTLQLYADFSGCIDITIGTAEIFGVTLPENFKRPFFAKTAAEFWRRWHITLGTWLKDYVFYPISLTKGVKELGKKSKEKLGRHLGQVIPLSVALLGVWLGNGLWHGTGWQYIAFGIYYFILIVLGNLFEPWVAKACTALKINRGNFFYRLMQTVKMLAIIFTGELIFRANGLRSAFYMLKMIFTNFQPASLGGGAVFKAGIVAQEFMVLGAALGVLLLVGVLQEKGVRIRETVSQWHPALRWATYYLLIMAIIIFGAYGDGYHPAAMMYAQF